MLQNLIKSLVKNNSTKMAIIVRTDLNMGRGKIASQTAHAAVSLYISAVKTQNPYLDPWLRSGQPKVVLKTVSLNQLNELFNQADCNKLNVCAIRDAGKTQIEYGTLTVLGIGPGPSEEIDKICQHLKLL